MEQNFLGKKIEKENLGYVFYETSGAWGGQGYSIWLS